MQSIHKLRIFHPLEIGAENPILRTPTVAITEITEEIKEFAEILLTLMWEYDGVGLAAPQIGKNLSMIATTQRKRMPNAKNPDKDFIGETLLINPKIIKHSQEKQISEEACLSLPDQRGYVERYQRVEVEYQDLKGTKLQQRFSGFNACIIQHEIDHLHGKLFIDQLLPTPKEKKPEA